MKKKDLIYAVLAVVIMLVAGYVAYTQLFPQTASNGGKKTVTVETVGVIPSSLDAAGLVFIGDKTKVFDYNSTPDFTGLGNRAPFGP